MAVGAGLSALAMIPLMHWFGARMTGVTAGGVFWSSALILFGVKTMHGFG